MRSMRPSVDGKDVPHLRVPTTANRLSSSNELSELHRLTLTLPRFILDYFEYVDVRVELSPLTRSQPIFSDFLFPDDSTTLGGLWPTDLLAHEREGSVNVTPVESRVSLKDQVA